MAKTLLMEDLVIPIVTYLAPGAVHPDVVVLRRRVNLKVPDANLSSMLDNRFTGDLQAALERFQAARMLPASGIADKATWAALYDVSPDVIAIRGEPSGGGASPLLWVAAAAAALWALS